MNITLRSLMVSGVLSATVMLLPDLSAAEGKIIATYGDAARTNAPAVGWSFLWNEKGEMGSAENYSPLSFNKKINLYYVLDESGEIVPGTPGGSKVYNSGKGDEPLRFYIASYTLQNDISGETWVNNGNIQYNYGGSDNLVLHIYLNDTLKADYIVKKNRTPLLFQNNLGHLKKGDVIRVAVGPGDINSMGVFGMHFTIEEFQTGDKPDAPVYIIAPPINLSDPPRGADGKYDKNYIASHTAQCELALKYQPELVFMGDSITSGWGGLLAEKIGKFKPANFGYGGDWIQKLRWRVENGVFDQINAKVIVLLIGTNNIGNYYTPEEVAEGTRLLVNTLREKSPRSKILLMGIFPRRYDAKDPIRESIRQVNAKTALLGDNKTVFFMDIGDKLVEPDGSISKEIMPDGLHPAAPGYVIWAEAITPTLERLFNEAL